MTKIACEKDFCGYIYRFNITLSALSIKDEIFYIVWPNYFGCGTMRRRSYDGGAAAYYASRIYRYIYSAWSSILNQKDEG
jgi:hypothetical protein